VLSFIASFLIIKRAVFYVSAFVVNKDKYGPIEQKLNSSV